MHNAGLAKLMVAGPEQAGFRLVGSGELTDYLFAWERFDS